jgi:hypothetical protein
VLFAAIAQRIYSAETYFTMRARVLSSGKPPIPACMLSMRCSNLLVAGMAQVTAGCEITNLSKNCAHVAQPISLLHGGNGLLRNFAKTAPAAKGRLIRTATRLSAASGNKRRSASRSTIE